jgi:hypothetical protein
MLAPFLVLDPFLLLAWDRQIARLAAGQQLRHA